MNRLILFMIGIIAISNLEHYIDSTVLEIIITVIGVVTLWKFFCRIGL